MSSIPLTSAASNVWPRMAGSAVVDPSIEAPIPFSDGGLFNLPTVNNPNLPPNSIRNTDNFAPPVPQTPAQPFPFLQQQPLGPTNSLISTNYATPQMPPSFSTNLVPYPAQTNQDEANHRRLTHLEDENKQRRATTSSLQEIGHQVLEGQIHIQEQVLQYQFMLEHCLESLDHQNFVLNGQSEEIALLQAKMRQFEYLMDAFKHSKKRNQLQRSTSGDANFIDNNLFCHRNPLLLHPPFMSPFSRGDVTRVTSSKFQPFNPRYRPSNLNESRNMTPSIPNSNDDANTRFSRPSN